MIKKWEQGEARESGVSSLPRPQSRHMGALTGHTGRVALTLFTIIVVLASGMALLAFSSGAWSWFTDSKPTMMLSTPMGQKISDGQQEHYQQIAARYVARMTLDEKLGQLLMVSYQEPSYSAGLDVMLARLHAGGVILYQSQINTRAQIQHDIARMRQRATFPLLIATDEEGGYVDRLTHIYPPRLSALAIYRTGDPTIAQRAGHQTAHDLLALGINTNLAPDSDVAVVNGPDQITRTFGFSAQSVITFAGAYLRALQQDNVIACVKHFPGLGAATTDAHFALPVVRRTKAQIYATELAPFRTFVQSPHARERPGMVMATDVLMPAIDPQFPAELSHVFISDILRKQFGYQGVVITDALTMRGIANRWDMSEATIQALKAGNDMILGINNATQMVRVIADLKSALQRGRLAPAQIDASVTRILALKLQYHLL